MYSLLLLIISIFFSSYSIAGNTYQVDLILFSYSLNESNPPLNSPIMPIPNSAIQLISGSSKKALPYHLLSPSQSSLRDEYYLLNRTHQYQILGHYSWIQPSQNQYHVALPVGGHNGWQIHGTVRVKQSNYFLVDTHLQVSPPNSPHSSYTIAHQQRVKSNLVYYFDNPQIGMLLKIH